MIEARDLYIFDLDGTLSDADHRRPILDDHSNPHRWAQFYDACDRDEPRVGAIHTFKELVLRNDCWIWSGRTDRVRQKTEDWLLRYGVFPHDMKMRSEGDNTPDDVLKKTWYDALPLEDKARLVATFDDRDRMVKMWRDLGIQCYQVNYGNF